MNRNKRVLPKEEMTDYDPNIFGFLNYKGLVGEQCATIKEVFTIFMPMMIRDNIFIRDQR